MKIGILGLGSIGRRHARNLMAKGHEVYGYDVNAAALGHFIAGGGKNMYDHYHNVDLDGMIIATPSSQHVEEIKSLAEQDLYLFVEKPIGVSQRDLADLRKLKPRHPIMVGNNLRFRSCVKQAKEWLDEKAIGTPSTATFNCRQLNRRVDYLREGVTSNWGAHEIDLALYLLGPATLRVATISDTDDDASLVLEHKSGIITAIGLDYNTVPEQRDFKIQNAAGNFISCNLVTNIASINADDNITNVKFGDRFGDNYVDEMEYFLNEISEDKPPALRAAFSDDGIAVLQIILDAKKAAAVARKQNAVVHTGE